jgi:hypothetical protein
MYLYSIMGKSGSKSKNRSVKKPTSTRKRKKGKREKRGKKGTKWTSSSSSKTKRKRHSRKGASRKQPHHYVPWKKRRPATRYSSRMNHMNGGTGSASSGTENFSLIPPGVTAIGRSMQFGLGSAYNAINGYDVPVNPLPYKDQLDNGDLPYETVLQS